jgi:hypothetical protein
MGVEKNLHWSYCYATTTSEKLPPNWRSLEKDLAYRIVSLTKNP